jgi:hypothetical protein
MVISDQIGGPVKDSVSRLWSVPYLEEARRAAVRGDIRLLLRLVALRPDFLDYDEQIRKVWIGHVVGLQGDIRSYDRFYRPYEGAACPLMLKDTLPGRRAAADKARRGLLELGRQFVACAIWKKTEKGEPKVREALREAHRGLSAFYRNVRQQERKIRRAWDRLLPNERQKIVQQATEGSKVRVGLGNLGTVIPIPPDRLVQRDPIQTLLQDPEQYDQWHKPSELAWRDLALLLEESEATLKRWLYRRRV